MQARKGRAGQEEQGRRSRVEVGAEQGGKTGRLGNWQLGLLPCDVETMRIKSAARKEQDDAEKREESGRGTGRGR